MEKGSAFVEWGFAFCSFSTIRINVETVKFGYLNLVSSDPKNPQCDSSEWRIILKNVAGSMVITKFSGPHIMDILSTRNPILSFIIRVFYIVLFGYFWDYSLTATDNLHLTSIFDRKGSASPPPLLFSSWVFLIKFVSSFCCPTYFLCLIS